MPKGKKSGKTRSRGYKQPPAGGGSDDESGVETCSVFSNGSSETKSVTYEDTASSPVVDEVDELTQEEIQEEKFKDAIDGAMQKSAQGRTNNIETLCTILTSQYYPEYLSQRHMTMTDIIHRSLKKGKAAEQAAAANLAPLMCVQLGAGRDSEEIYKELRPILIQILTDNSGSPLVRGKCATSVSLLTFLASEEVCDLWNTLSVLENIWKGKCANALITDVLTSWSLILTLLSPSEVYMKAEVHLLYLMKLLKSEDVSVRIAAGECIALVYERSRYYDEDFCDSTFEELCQLLQELATDSHKYRAKKDRKQQRSCFRDVLKTVEVAETPSDMIRFGRETLYINSWLRKQQYESFCNVLRSGMNLHLSENELLRDIFALGPPLPTLKPQQYKASKLERHLVNMAAFKERTLVRGKFRDKRTAVF